MLEMKMRKISSSMARKIINGPVAEIRGGKYYKIVGAEGTEAVILTYTNRFHSQNLYIQPYFLKGKENCAAVSMFIHKRFAKPLQCMVDSDDPRVEILKAGGFKLLRKCYEREFEPSQLKRVAVESAGIVKFTAGDNVYMQAVKLLFNQYRENHAAINPLSVELEKFAADLPQCVYCAEGGEDKGFAFTEENEICYVGGSGELSEFFESLLRKLFSHFKTVQFEADDTDPAAMQLKNLFLDNDDSSFDTWVLSEDNL